MSVSFVTKLSNLVPTAVKWTIVADFSAQLLLAFQALPVTIYGIPTVLVTSIVTPIVVYWENQAKINEAALQAAASKTSLPAGQAAQPAPAVQLPALPQGFSLEAAKSAGFDVYENAQGSLILVSGGMYTDAYGNKLPKQDSSVLTGYTKL